MANKLTEYSATNSLNTDVGGVNIDEGMLPSDVNNAIREVMTHLKDFAEGTQAVNAVAVDNLKLDANTLSSTNTNGNILIDPNGTGSVQLGGNLDLNGNDITGTGDINITGTVTADGADFSGGADSTGQIVLSQGNGATKVSKIVGTGPGGTNERGIDFNTYYYADYKRMNIAAEGDVSLYDSSGVSQGFFWDASTQRLGLGTTAPSAGADIRSAHTGTNFYGQAFLASTDSQAANKGGVLSLGGSYTGTTPTFFGAIGGFKEDSIDGNYGGYLTFATRPNGGNNAERMRITSGGNVGIGTAAPVGKFTVTDASSSFMFRDFSGNAKILLDGANGDFSGGDYMEIEADSSPNLMFKQANTERARLDSSGNLLVGTTTAFGTTGTTINQAGLLYSSADGDRSGQFDRTGTDGEVIRVTKAGSTVGSIGARSGNLYTVSGDTGLKFLPTNDEIVPCTTDGAGRDAAIDLGSSGTRFKDLYLSGGVYLGGTGASNLMDDYEEGTWTPTLATSGASPTYSVQAGHYTKIGRVVYFKYQVDISGGSFGSGNIQVGGLPFTPDASVQYGRIPLQTNSVNIDGSAFDMYHYVSGGTLHVLYSYDNAGWSVATTASFIVGAGSILTAKGFYFV